LVWTDRRAVRCFWPPARGPRPCGKGRTSRRDVPTGLSSVRGSPPSAQGIPCDEDVWPVRGVGDQAGAHGVHEDVIRLFIQGLVVAEAVVEKVPLPRDVAKAPGPPFEIQDRLPHRVCRIRKMEDRVRVIGHEEEDPAIPCPGLVPTADGLEDCGRVAGDDIRSAQSVTKNAASSTGTPRGVSCGSCLRPISMRFLIAHLGQREERNRQTSGGDGSPSRPSLWPPALVRASQKKKSDISARCPHRGLARRGRLLRSASVAFPAKHSTFPLYDIGAIARVLP